MGNQEKRLRFIHSRGLWRRQTEYCIQSHHRYYDPCLRYRRHREHEDVNGNALSEAGNAHCYSSRHHTITVKLLSPFLDFYDADSQCCANIFSSMTMFCCDAATAAPPPTGSQVTGFLL